MSFVPIVGSIIIVVYMLTSRRSAGTLMKAVLVCAGLFVVALLTTSTMAGTVLLAIVSLLVPEWFQWLCFFVLLIALAVSSGRRDGARAGTPDLPAENGGASTRRRLRTSVVLLVPILGLGALVWKYNSDRVCVGFSEFGGGCMKRLAPLHDAAAKGQLILARVLLALGSDPKGASVYEDPPIIWAIRAARVEMTQLLLARGATVTERQRTVGSGPRQAIASGTANAFAILCGAPVSSQIGTPPPPDRLIAIAQLLEKAGADPNYRYSQNGSTPLAFCIATGRLEFARYLLSRGVDVNQGSRYEIGTPLLAAHKRGDAELIAALRAAGAECSQQDTARAFFEDQVYGYVEACQNKGFRVRLLGPPYDDRARKRFLSALSSREVVAVRAFLEAEMSPNEPFEQGRTPLHVVIDGEASLRGAGSTSAAIAIVRCLRAYGADVQAKDQPDSRIDRNKVPETAIGFAQRVRPDLVAALLEDDPRCEPGT